MHAEKPPLTALGPTLEIGAHASVAADGSDFHAIYAGDAFGNARRGTLAVVASGSGPGRQARNAAELAARSLAEGYFGAAPTLGASRAIGLALSATNAWMFGISRAGDNGAQLAASLSAVIFAGRHVHIVHIGGCRVYRRRAGELVPLTNEHVRLVVDGAAVLSRAIGADQELYADLLEDAPEPGDRYVILSRGGYEALARRRLAERLLADDPPEVLARRLTEAAEAARNDAAHGDGGRMGGATVVAIEVQALPSASFDEMAARFVDLPLRPPPREGDNWDGFVLGRTLYRSHYTVLRRARDTIGNREVVLKIPLPAMLQDEVFRAGFLREAWIGTTVQSRWVARYIDLPPGRRSSLYLVMPYYRGETLEARLLREPPIPFREGIGIALKLCRAVEDLWALQIVHRDLKPENVLLLPTGDVRLLDLGLAYLPALDQPEEDRLGGTTRYMAPELFHGSQATPRSEVFALGVTIYRLFAGGAFPFGQREPRPLARLRPDLPAWLGDCLARAIDMAPEKRLRDAGALAEALRAGLRRGDAIQSPRRSGRRFDPLRLWQTIAVLFATGFFILLALLLGGRG